MANLQVRAGMFSYEYYQGQWQCQEKREKWERENKLEKKLLFTEHLLSARYFQVELHSMDENTEAPEDEAIQPGSHIN